MITGADGKKIERAVIEASARETAVRKGYKFTELRLKDPAYNGMCGAEVLKFDVRVDHVTGQMEFTFKVDGGPLNFDLDITRNGRFHHFVDTPHNRAALPGYVAAGIVEVVGHTGGAPEVKSKEEYFAELNKERAAKGLAPVGEDSGSVNGDGTPSAVVEGGENVPASVPVVPPAYPPVRKASKPPAGRSLSGVEMSPLVSITE